jgi:hypothetical protein
MKNHSQKRLFLGVFFIKNSKKEKERINSLHFFFSRDIIDMVSYRM